jgi:hypothetical protein
MTSSNVVLNMASDDTRTMEEEVNLTIPEVIDLIEMAVNSHPKIVTIRPYEVAITTMETVIAKLTTLQLDLVEVLSDSPVVKEFIYLLLTGYIKTRNVLNKKLQISPFTVIYIPEKSLVDPSVINVSGQFVYKGKPVMSLYNKVVFEDIIQRSYDVRTDINLVDALMQSPDADIWNKIGAKSHLEFDIQTMTNLEVATLMNEGSLELSLLSSFPNVRKKKIEKLLTLLG